jgi:hypothetical protein
MERLLSNPVISMFLFWRNAMTVSLGSPAHYSETPGAAVAALQDD